MRRRVCSAFLFCLAQLDLKRNSSNIKSSKTTWGGSSMKTLWVLCIMLLGMSSTQSFERSVQNVPDHSSEPATQNLPSSTNDQAVQLDQDAATLAATGSIYQPASITQITSQTPSGPWSLSDHVNVTVYAITPPPQPAATFPLPLHHSPPSH